jgi:hypothetical protein
VPQLPATADSPLLDGWYHTIDFGGGMVSRGHFDHRTVVDSYGIPESLEGKTALDVASADGFFSFELERRGATVTAIDVDSLGDCDWLPQTRRRQTPELLAATPWKDRFEMAHAMLGSGVERIHCSVYDLSPERIGTFDVVFCGDLLVHLQNPLAALINIRSVTRELAVVETVADPEIERWLPGQPYLSFGMLDHEEQPGDLVSYWRFSTQALVHMMTYADFERIEPKPWFALPPMGLRVVSAVGHVSG